MRGAVVGLLLLLSAAAVSAREPAESYLLHCSACHGVDGRGVPGLSPDLRELRRLYAAEGGPEYLVRVPGVAQSPAGDAELAALLNWLLGSVEGPYSAAEVGALRRQPLRDPAAARPALP